MKNKQLKWAAVLTAILSLVFFISACGSSALQNSGQVQVIYPTVYITQFVTQVVVTGQAPVAVAQSPAKETPIPVAQNSTAFNPFSVQIYYPLVGCSASRLHLGDQASIQYSDRQIGLYHYKSLAFEPDLRYLPVGMEVNITDGPYCNENVIFWKVQSPDKQVFGFYPEGNGDTYWMLPTGPSVSTPDLMGGVHPSNFLHLHMPYKCNGR